MSSKTLQFSLLLTTIGIFGTKKEDNAPSLSKQKRYEIISNAVQHDKKNNISPTLNTIIQRKKETLNLLATEPITKKDIKLNSQININSEKYLETLNNRKKKIIDTYIDVQQEMAQGKNGLYHSLAGLEYATHAESQQLIAEAQILILNFNLLIGEKQQKIDSLIGDSDLSKQMQTIIDNETYVTKKLLIIEKIKKHNENEPQLNDFASVFLHVKRTTIYKTDLDNLLSKPFPTKKITKQINQLFKD